jgi:carboxypeptidase C (cathepsin A)
MLRKWLIAFGLTLAVGTWCSLAERTLSASSADDGQQTTQKDKAQDVKGDSKTPKKDALKEKPQDAKSDAQPPAKDKAPEAKDSSQPAPKEPASEVMGVCTINDQKIEYTVTTGRMPVKDMTGKAQGKIFYIAYIRKTNLKPANRPLTFSFNGGPGSSSSYVHMGAFGPRRVAIDEDGKSIPTPYRLVENECSLLDATDLVFIDPVSTGYSRADNDKDAKLFHGLEEDCYSVGEFIRSYVAKNNRQQSPTFIAGESYGTTRSAALSHYLQAHGGVKLQGIMLISTVLDFSTIQGGANNNLPNILYLPTYTAAALHHNKLSGDPATLIAESEMFANGPYADALRKGKDLPADEREMIAKTFARLSGLSEEYVLKANLRVNAGTYRSELLRETSENIGRYDSRVKAKFGGMGGGKGGGKGGGADPSNSLTSPAFTACINNYLADELKCKTDLKYNVSAQVQPWPYPSGKKTVVPRLRSALEKDPSFRVFVACGYCDMATPFSAAKWTMSQFYGPTMQERITVSCYEGGHMMYTVRASHHKLREDMVKFIRAGEVAKPAPNRELTLGALGLPDFGRFPTSLSASFSVGGSFGGMD